MGKISIYLLLLIFCSCETEKIIFKGPYHVRFTNLAFTEKESNSKIVKIEVHNAGSELKADLNISYSLSGNAREGVDFEIVGTRGKVTIKKGKYLGYIEVKLINNANNILRSQDVHFTLSSVDDINLAVGQGEGGIGVKFTLTILDDCILGGTYNGSRNAFSIPKKNITVTSTDCENYVLSNWNIDFFRLTDPIPLNFIDNGDNTITIKRQEQAEFPEDIATIEGFGSVNPLTKEIFMTIKLVDFKDSPEVSFTLIPQ